MSENLTVNKKQTKKVKEPKIKKPKVTMAERIDNLKTLFKNLASSSVETRYKAIKTVNKAIVSLCRYVILIAIGYIILYPLIFMLSAMWRTRDSFFDPSVVWITTGVTTDYVVIAWQCMEYIKSFLNTLLYEIVSAAIQILSCALVAYGMARFEFKEKKFLYAILFMTIIVPPTMMSLPIVQTYKQIDVLGILGLLNDLTGIDLRINILNSVWTFYLPALFAVGIRSGIIIYIYIQFFKGLPKELEEASWIDGAGPLKTFFKIALPSSGVVIMTVSVFSLVWHWNDYNNANLYLFSNNQTLAVMLNNIETLMRNHTLKIQTGPQNPESIAIIMASCVMFVIPILVVYMILQKNFVKSIDRVGITG